MFNFRTGLIASLIQCCNDQDHATRKFACFAVGNASFHSDMLYPSLRPSIPALVELLKDDDEKTRSNAAGKYYFVALLIEQVL